jgi:cystathionine beta-lyase/cystathionine gamma-synthase
LLPSGIADSLVRVSVGFEDEADLLTDFTHGTECRNRVA